MMTMKMLEMEKANWEIESSGPECTGRLFRLSPFTERATDFIGGLKANEIRLYDWIMKGEVGGDNKMVFKEVNDSFPLFWKDVQTLGRKVWVHCSIVDAWCRFLNDMESLKSPEAPSRAYISTYAPTQVVNAEVLNTEVGMNFKEQVRIESRRFNKTIDNTDLLFECIYMEGHYFMMCFDTRDATIEIYDNLIVDVSDEERYRDKPDWIRKCMCDVVADYDVQLAVRFREAVIRRVDVPWASATNKDDCGIFTMWHCEDYMGRRSWKACLKKDAVRQMFKLRVRFLFKLMTWSRNVCWDDIYVEAGRMFKEQSLEFVVKNEDRAI